MKPAIFFLVAIVYIIVGPLSAYSVDNENSVSEQHLKQEKKKYEDTMEERLSRLGKKLDEINSKAAFMTEQARKELNQYLDVAKKKQRTALRKLREIRAESIEKWKQFTSQMDAAADNFSKAYENAKSHVKE